MRESASASVTVNGEHRQVSADENLLDVLGSMNIDRDARGVAVAVNDEVLRREEWGSVALNHGDRIEVVTAQQGG